MREAPFIEEVLDETGDIMSDKVYLDPFYDILYLRQEDEYLTDREFKANEKFQATICLTKEQARELHKLLELYLNGDLR